MNVSLVFGLLVIYQLKHLLADYFLQREYQLGKFKDGWAFFWPLVSHVAIHATFTFFSAFYFANDLKFSLLLALFDGTIHFFMDRIKAGKRYLGRFKPVTAAEYMECKNILSEDNTYYDLSIPKRSAQQKLDHNSYFWISLGFDQFIHHLTHYACIYLILHKMGYI